MHPRQRQLRIKYATQIGELNSDQIAAISTSLSGAQFATFLGQISNDNSANAVVSPTGDPSTVNVTGIYFRLGPVGIDDNLSIPDEHSAWVITYSDGEVSTLEYGPTNSNSGNLVQQHYDDAFDPSASNVTDFTQTGIAQYGSLGAAASALIENSAILATNLNSDPLRYGYVANNCNTAVAGLGLQTFGTLPTISLLGSADVGFGGTVLDGQFLIDAGYFNYPADWLPGSSGQSNTPLFTIVPTGTGGSPYWIQGTANGVTIRIK